MPRNRQVLKDAPPADAKIPASMDTRKLFQEVFRRSSLGERLVLGTLVATGGSTLRRPGARVVFPEVGCAFGAVSGGCVEGDLALRIGDVLASGRARLVDYDAAANDPLFGLGSGCDGTLRVLLEPVDARLAETLRGAAERLPFEPVRLRVAFETTDEPLGTSVESVFEASADVPPPLNCRTDARGSGVLDDTLPSTPSLLLFGAGPIAVPLADLAATLGFRIVVADHRPAFVDRISADERITGSIGELPSRVRAGREPYAVVSSHLFEADRAWTTALLRDRSIRGVWLLGSRGRSGKLLSDIPTTDPVRARLHAPAGLDLGAETPAEIALSILAEISAVRRNASARPLRETTGPIHRDANGVTAVILAAGGSRRFGSAKAATDVGGEPMVRRVAAAAIGAGCDELLVVTGPSDRQVRSALDGIPASFLPNPEWESGIASSIRLAAAELAARKASAALFLLADQPHLDAASLRQLFARRAETGAAAVCASYPEGAGVPALLDASLFPLLSTLSGDVGAREILRKLPRVTELVELPATRLRDVDTPADLES